MSAVEFVEELPPVGGKRGPKAPGRWQLVTDELRTRPGQWAHVADGGTDCRNGHSRLRVYGCEAVIRTVDMQERLYARWPKGNA